MLTPLPDPGNGEAQAGELAYAPGLWPGPYFPILYPAKGGELPYLCVGDTSTGSVSPMDCTPLKVTCPETTPLPGALAAAAPWREVLVITFPGLTNVTFSDCLHPKVLFLNWLDLENSLLQQVVAAICTPVEAAYSFTVVLYF